MSSIYNNLNYIYILRLHDDQFKEAWIPNSNQALMHLSIYRVLIKIQSKIQEVIIWIMKWKIQILALIENMEKNNYIGFISIRVWFEIYQTVWD